LASKGKRVGRLVELERRRTPERRRSRATNAGNNRKKKNVFFRSPMPMREEMFLEEVVRNPDDRTIYPMLADWLEENDDPRRAELLRLRCRMHLKSS
jgi:uncharacterized protein (TIGR02996 family)